MSGFADYVTSLKFRDVIRTIVQKELEGSRPQPKKAVVQSIDRGNFKCNVIYVGETNAVNVRMPSIQPAANGQTVLIDGKPSSRYVAMVYGPTYDSMPAGTIVTQDVSSSVPDGWSQVGSQDTVGGVTVRYIRRSP